MVFYNYGSAIDLSRMHILNCFKKSEFFAVVGVFTNKVSTAVMLTESESLLVITPTKADDTP